MINVILFILVAISLLCMLPLVFGLLLLLLFLVYCVLFAWSAIIPIFSWHFRLMCKVWYLGLDIVLNGTMWKLAGVGALIMFVLSLFR